MTRQSILARLDLVLALMAVGDRIRAKAVIAQDRSQVEIVPNNPHTGVVMLAAFSPDGTRVVSASGDEIKLWNLASGQLIRTFLGHTPALPDGIKSVAFSPDGARLLSGSDDMTVRLWDAASGQLIRTFAGHEGKVASVAFSPDGARVVSGSFDSTIKLWDAARGQRMRTF